MKGRLFGVVLLPALYFVSALLWEARHPSSLRIPEVPEGAPVPARVQPKSSTPTPQAVEPRPTAGSVEPAKPDGAGPSKASPAEASPTGQPAPAPAPAAAGLTASPKGALRDVSGEVLDLSLGKPAVGVTVSLPELRREVSTGSDGHFRLPAVPVRRRPYELMVSGGAFRTVTIDLAVGAGDGPLDVGPIKLKPRGW